MNCARVKGGLVAKRVLVVGSRRFDVAGYSANFYTASACKFVCAPTGRRRLCGGSPATTNVCALVPLGVITGGGFVSSAIYGHRSPTAGVYP